MPSLLDVLRQSTRVDCDTLDSNLAKSLGPFVDCTSNQAIAYLELLRQHAEKSALQHSELINDSIQNAKDGLKDLRGDVTFEEFVVEIMMVKLQILVFSVVTGYIHIQTNPRFSYSKARTVANAKRLLAIFKALSPKLDPQRICIKIPATWEGLQACRELEAKGIATLATTLFCMEQAALAADAKCTYIAPYVNELKAHFDKEYVDKNKAFDLCREAQAYFIAGSHRTQVLAASLTSVEEVMRLAGIQHITISPPLLQQLAAIDASSWDGDKGEWFARGPTQRTWGIGGHSALLHDEAMWKLDFARSDFGASEGKIVQAINYFCDFQEKMEGLVKSYSG